MKHYLVCFLLICIPIYKAQSQTYFGIKGGLNLTFFKVIDAGFGDDPEVEVGYYAGVFADIQVNSDLSIQPEVLYIGLNDFKFINAPIYLKYEVANGLYILAGPSLNYFIDFFSNKFKVRADLSTSYQISRSLDIHLKYTLGFEEISPNGLFLGLDFKL